MSYSQWTRTPPTEPDFYVVRMKTGKETIGNLYVDSEVFPTFPPFREWTIIGSSETYVDDDFELFSNMPVYAPGSLTYD